MNRFKLVKRVVLLGLMCALVLGGATAIVSARVPEAYAASAHAEITCHDHSCNGVDPKQAGCWNSSAYYFSYSSSYGWEHFWYSPTCETNWVEAGTYSGYTIGEIQMTNCPSGQTSGRQCINLSNNQYVNQYVVYCEGQAQPGAAFCTQNDEHNVPILNDIDLNPGNYWWSNMIDGSYKAWGSLIFAQNVPTIWSGWH